MKADKPVAESPVRVGALDTLPAIRVELGRLYRASRRKAGGDPTPSDAAKLAFILSAVHRSIEVEEVRREIADIKRSMRWRPEQ